MRARNFPSAEDEAKAAQPHGRYDGPGSSFRMAFTDTDFLLREELRPVRLQLELLKAELVQQEQGVEFHRGRVRQRALQGAGGGRGRCSKTRWRAATRPRSRVPGRW